MLPSIAEQATLPHSEESERAVLAAVLLDARGHLPQTSSRLRTDDFYFERHQKLYQGMLDLQEAGVEVDLRTLQARLEQQNELELVGGVAYLAGLDVDLPYLGRVDTYVEIIKERSLRRRLIHASWRIRSRNNGLPSRYRWALCGCCRRIPSHSAPWRRSHRGARWMSPAQ